ncbi:MAG: alpha/beta hydrolase [Anaerolineae bacterium]
MFITHDGAQLFTVSFGRHERTLLALGGWAGSWELWVEPFAELSQTWRTVAYDHRGAGATIAPTESITIDTMVDDVFAVMDAMGIDKCVLAAESAGASIAILAALRKPERISGLILVDGMYYVPDSTGLERFNARLKNDFSGGVGSFVESCLTTADGDEFRRWGQQILMRSTPEAAIQLNVCMKNMDLRTAVKGITHRTLIMHGDADAIIPLKASEWLAKEMPNSKLQIIKGAGHVPTITHPHIVAEAIDRYFVAS